MTRYPDPTTEQLEALARFAEQHGRTWKAQLSDLWMRAAADSILPGLRNSHDPPPN